MSNDIRELKLTNYEPKFNEFINCESNVLYRNNERNLYMSTVSASDSQWRVTVRGTK